MALVNIDTIVNDTIRIAGSLSPDTGVELMSYKRNRTISITFLGNQMFRLVEKGYVEQETTISFEELPKRLKKAVKKEFPRSRKVRLFKFTDPIQLDRHH